MTPILRKFFLTLHITFSVGWLGAVVVFLALAIAGLNSHNSQFVRSAYISMDFIGWYVIVPANFGALLTGLVLSLGSQWGLFRHYWVLVKFLLTIGATILLLLHMQPISNMADIASESTSFSSEDRSLQIQLVFDASAALFVLLVATILSVYKPWGRTKYGLRKQHEQNKSMALLQSNTRKPWGRYVLIGLIGLVLLVIIWHLLGGGLGHH